MVQLGEVIFGKLTASQQGEIERAGWERNAGTGMIVPRGTVLTPGQVKEINEASQEGQWKRAQFGVIQQNIPLQQKFTPEQIKSMPTDAPKIAQTILEVKPVYSNGQLTGFQDTRLGMSYSLQNIPESRVQDLVKAGIITIEQPIIKTQDIHAQILRGQTLPAYISAAPKITQLSKDELQKAYGEPKQVSGFIKGEDIFVQQGKTSTLAHELGHYYTSPMLEKLDELTEQKIAKEGRRVLGLKYLDFFGGMKEYTPNQYSKEGLAIAYSWITSKNPLKQSAISIAMPETTKFIKRELSKQIIAGMPVGEGESINYAQPTPTPFEIEQAKQTIKFATPTTIPVPQKVTIGAPSYAVPQMEIPKAGVLDVVSTPVEMIRAGGKWVTGGYERLLAGEPRDLPVIKEIGIGIRKIIPEQQLTKITEVPAKMDIIPFDKTIIRKETISGQYLLTPKTLEIVPTRVGYIPKVAGFGAELGAYYFTPTAILSPSFMASGIKTYLAAPKEVPWYESEQKFAGALEFGIGAGIGTYAGYKYLRTPTIKKIEISPKLKEPTDISGRTFVKNILEQPTGEKIGLEPFKVRGREFITHPGFRTVVSERWRDILRLEPIYKGYPYGFQVQYKKALEVLTKRARLTESGARDILAFRRPISEVRFDVGKGVLITGGKEPTAKFKVREITLPYPQTPEVLKVKGEFYPIRTRAVPEMKFVDITKIPAKPEDLLRFGVKPVKGVDYFKGTQIVEKSRLTPELFPYVKISEAGKLKTQYEFIAGVKEFKTTNYVDIFKTSQISKQIIPIKRDLIISPIRKVGVMKGEPLLTISREPIIKIKPDITITKPKFTEVKFPTESKQVLDLGKLTITPKVPTPKIVKVPTKPKMDIIPPSVYQKTIYGIPIAIKDIVELVPKPTRTGAFTFEEITTIPKSGVFAPTGEKVIGLPKEKVYLPSGVKVKLGEIQVEKPEELERVREELGLINLGRLKPLESLMPVERLKPLEQLKQLEILKPVEKLKQIEKLKLVEKVIPQVITPRIIEPKVPDKPRVPPPTFLILPRRRESKFGIRIPKISKGLFIAEITKRGKFKPVSIGELGKVTIAGVRAVKRELGASLRVREVRTGKQVRIPFISREFRPGKREPLTLVQKAPTRLMTIQERRAIQQARGGMFSLR